jgi:uncharacterized protein
MRLIAGRWGWWCIAAAGTALVPDGLVHDGALTPAGLAAVESAGLLTPRPVRHYSLTVVTASACNLGCPYCFQNTGPAAAGRFDPPRIPRSRLDPSTVGALVAFARDRMAALSVRRLHLVLFGGEPLLNPAGCLDVLTRCADLGRLTATMVTNGVLLRAPLARRLHAAGLDSVQVTVDGPPEVHDGLRTDRRGGGTYAGIVSNVAAAQETTGLEFTIRVNLTGRAVTRLAGLIEDLSRALDARRCGFGIAPVLDYGWGATDPLPPTRSTVQRILDAYTLAHERGFQVARPGSGHCDFCSVERGRYGAVVNADGALFSCWDTVGRPDFQVGTVHTGYSGYPPDRWVGCGSLAAPSAGPDARRFTGEIDAGLLDLHRLWRLDTRRPDDTNH